MIISIRVIPRASRNYISKENGVLKVYLTKPAQDGLANIQLISLLSGYLRVKKYQIKIIKGHTCRNKLIQIDA